MQGRFQLYIVLLFTCLCCHGVIGYAQEADDAPTAQNGEQSAADALQEEGETISQEVRQLDDELDKLNVSYRTAKGEQKDILASQIHTKRKDLASGLDKLVSHIGKLNDAEQDSAKPKRLAKSLLTDLSDDLRNSIGQSEADVIEVLERKSRAEPDEVSKLEDEIEAINVATDDDLSTYIAVVQDMQSLGIDTNAQFQFLDSTIKQRGKRLASELRFLSDKLASSQKSVAGLSEEDKQEQIKTIRALDKRIEEISSHLNAAVAIMKDREMETADYTQLLIETTGELTEDIFKTEVALGLFQRWVEKGQEWVLGNGPRWIFKIIVFLLILLGFRFLSGIARRLMRKAVTTSKIDLSQLLQEQTISFTGKAVMFLGILVALSQLGIQLGPLLAGLGIAGFIIGFALQDTLSNFASGMMILVYRPYDVGDAVEAGGVMGSVKAMNLVSTTIATWDNQKLVVPNSKIWGDVIRNITAEPHRRVDMTFGISYADDVDHAERVLWDIIKGNELVLSEPEPVIALHSLGESSVDFVVRPWVKTSDYWTLYWAVTREVKKRFDQEGISIPFPQRDVHLIQQKEVVA